MNKAWGMCRAALTGLGSVAQWCDEKRRRWLVESVQGLNMGRGGGGVKVSSLSGAGSCAVLEFNSLEHAAFGFWTNTFLVCSKGCCA